MQIRFLERKYPIPDPPPFLIKNLKSDRHMRGTYSNGMFMRDDEGNFKSRLREKFDRQNPFLKHGFSTTETYTDSTESRMRQHKTEVKERRTEGS